MKEREIIFNFPLKGRGNNTLNLKNKCATVLGCSGRL